MAWCKHAFTTYSKCDVVMDNLRESFNNVILPARDKPIIAMLDWIKIYLMTRFNVMREKLKILG